MYQYILRILSSTGMQIKLTNVKGRMWVMCTEQSFIKCCIQENYEGAIQTSSMLSHLLGPWCFSGEMLPGVFGEAHTFMLLLVHSTEILSNWKIEIRIAVFLFKLLKCSFVWGYYHILLNFYLHSIISLIIFLCSPKYCNFEI